MLSRLCYLLLSALCCSAVVIKTKLGDVRGVVTIFEQDVSEPVSIFRGVPYAKPPIGDLRFAKPERVSPWEGEKDATQFGSACLQAYPFPGITSESEDCLYLNIFIPENVSMPVSERKAVMAFIHGGGFITGSGAIDVTGLAALSDAIVVTLNYRLGAFGFLNSDGASPFNLALLDQHLALQWVRDNIEEFGGDAGNITIFGESAGSVCVGYHLVSPLSDNRLFQRAILQSGSIFGYSYYSQKDNAIQLAKQLLCDASNSEEAVECLKTKPAADIIRKSMAVHSVSPFVPSAGDNFIAHDPIEILSNFTLFGVDTVINSVGNLGQFDILAGFNVQEGLLSIGYDRNLSGKNLTKGIDESAFLTGIESAFQNYGFSSDTRSVLAEMTAAQYVQPVHGSSELNLEQKYLRWYVDIQGDHLLSWPTIETGLLHSAVAPSKKTYLYKFDHKRSFGAALWDEGPSWLRMSAGHGDELFYIFYNRKSY